MSAKSDNKSKVKDKSKQNQKKKKNSYGIDPVRILMNVVSILFGTGILGAMLYYGMTNPKIKQRSFIRDTNYAYKLIQDELVKYYKQRGYVYKSKNEKVDEFCLELGNKFAESHPDCLNGGGIMKTNFVFKDKKIEILGMEQPAFERDGGLVKDFLIDINGSGVGKDEIGADRVPVRIYSTGRMGGLMSPVNCNHQDFLELDIEYADICHNGPEIDFMTTNIPFGYDVFQIGGKEGNTRPIGRDMPFLRADCTAFAGDMANLDEYCEKKGLYWHKDCYQEYECSVLISKEKI